MKKVSFEKTRWIYKKKGIDYGPFSHQEIKTLIFKGEISPSIPIYELREKKWTKISEVREFEETYNKYLSELKRRQEEITIEKITNRVTKVQKLKNRFPLILTGCIIFCGIIIAILLNPSNIGRGGVLLNIYKDINLETLEEFKKQEKFFSEITNKKEKGERKTPQKKVMLSKAFEENRKEGVTELSFEEETLPPLTEKKLNSIIGSVKTQVAQCFNKEGKVNPSFSNATLVFFINNDGSLSLSNLTVTNPYSRDLISCLKRVFQGIKFSPFSGGNKRVEIPVMIKRD